MERVNPCVLTINGGSSSIKFAIFELGNPLKWILKGKIERIGQEEAVLQVKHVDSSGDFSQKVQALSYNAAVNILVDWLEKSGTTKAFVALGHRIVHGGKNHSKAESITLEVIKDLADMSPFDPEHMPGEIFLIEEFQRRFPKIPQVACFDTAFHRDMPRVASLLPIPRRYEERGVRRYGFHGLSYEFLMSELGSLNGGKAAKGRVILAHLGNGASLAAVRDGKPMDTSMSFTPVAGVPMGTRSGDLDPGLAWYLFQTEGMDMSQFNKMVNSESGLLGISELSSDMRELLDHEADDARAAEAIALFCYQIKKWIGAFAAGLGGLDTLVFSGGIGENAPTIRARICEGLEFLGVELEEGQNVANKEVISTDTSRVIVRVIHADEEWTIANTVCQVLDLKK